VTEFLGGWIEWDKLCMRKFFALSSVDLFSPGRLPDEALFIEDFLRPQEPTEIIQLKKMVLNVQHDVIENESKREFICVEHPGFTGNRGVKYLGQVVGNDFDIVDRRKRGGHALALAGQFFPSVHSRTINRVRGYALMRSRVAYGLESRDLSWTDRKRLQSLDAQALTNMLNVKSWERRVYRISNADLRFAGGYEGFDGWQVHKTLRFAGHLIRLPTNRLTKLIFFGFARPGREDTITPQILSHQTALGADAGKLGSRVGNYRKYVRSLMTTAEDNIMVGETVLVTPPAPLRNFRDIVILGLCRAKWRIALAEARIRAQLRDFSRAKEAKMDTLENIKQQLMTKHSVNNSSLNSLDEWRSPAGEWILKRPVPTGWFTARGFHKTHIVDAITPVDDEADVGTEGSREDDRSTSKSDRDADSESECSDDDDLSFEEAMCRADAPSLPRCRWCQCELDVRWVDRRFRVCQQANKIITKRDATKALKPSAQERVEIQKLLDHENKCSMRPVRMKEVTIEKFLEGENKEFQKQIKEWGPKVAIPLLNKSGQFLKCKERKGYYSDKESGSASTIFAATKKASEILRKDVLKDRNENTLYDEFAPNADRKKIKPKSNAYDLRRYSWLGRQPWRRYKRKLLGELPDSADGFGVKRGNKRGKFVYEGVEYEYVPNLNLRGSGSDRHWSATMRFKTRKKELLFREKECGSFECARVAAQKAVDYMQAEKDQKDEWNWPKGEKEFKRQVIREAREEVGLNEDVEVAPLKIREPTRKTKPASWVATSNFPKVGRKGIAHLDDTLGSSAAARRAAVITLDLFETMIETGEKWTKERSKEIRDQSVKEALKASP